jgi:hypothetical protein
MCNNKRRFKGEADAVYALNLINPGRANAKKPSRAYKCPQCNGWHLTRAKA